MNGRDEVNIETMQVGFLLCNCYILSDETKIAVIIDPGAEGDRIINHLREHELNLEAILITHSHFDHIGAVKQIVETTNAKLYLGDSVMAKEFGEIATVINDGSIVTVGSMNFNVISSPGHSSDSLCFLNKPYLFTGDTLFHMGVGRTDLPGSSIENLKQSLQRIKELPFNDLIVLPGHMQETTLKFEKANNPYLV